jgi:hypothetical protein
MLRRRKNNELVVLFPFHPALKLLLLALGALLLGACARSPRLDPAVPVSEHQWSTGVLPTGNVLHLPAVAGVRNAPQDIPIVAVLVYDPEDPGRTPPKVYWYFQLADGRCQRWYVSDDHLYYAVSRELRLGPAEAPQEVKLSRDQKVMQLVQRVKAAPGLRQVKLCDCLTRDDPRLNVVSAGPKGWQGTQNFVLLGIQGDEVNNPTVRAKTLDLVRKTNIETVGSERNELEPEVD